MVSKALHFAIILAALLSGCGGGSSTAGAVVNPPPDSGPTDSEVAAAAAAVLAAADNPDAALQSFQQEVARVYEETPDDAAHTIVNSYLGEIQTPNDWNALFEAMQNAPNVFAPPPELSGLAGTGVDCPPLEGGTIVYFVNGIWTTPQSAMICRQALETAIRAGGIAVPRENIRLFYNKSGLENEAVGSLCGAYAVSSSWWAFSALRSVVESLYRRVCVGMVGGIADLAEASVQWLSFSPDASDRDVIGLRNAIQQDILSGKKVIVVAHSQGNFFAQMAVDGLPSDSIGDMRRGVAVVALASPASYPLSGSYGDFDHLTLMSDVVGRVVPGALPGNGSNDVSDHDLLGFATHNFVESYLGSWTSRDRILGMIRRADLLVTNPRTQAGQGFFQVTLTWDIPGDIDLHVHEPTGDHVYFADKVGIAGELDRDDIAGTGPENYFVCSREAVSPGAYVIRVNNFSGTTGTVADIVVRAGTQVRSFQVVMDPKNFGSNLLPVAEVAYDGSTGTFSFVE